MKTLWGSGRGDVMDEKIIGKLTGDAASGARGLPASLSACSRGVEVVEPRVT